LTEEFTNLSPSEDFSGDERRVKQILLNLLSNAVKFTPPEGQVCLKMHQEGNTAIIEVVDNGIGIPEHKQHLVFERFEQLNHHHEGTGLGLALTRQLVEMHGGTIEFTSTVGEGTAFIVRLQSQPQSQEKAVV
jgi:two-component system sensor histidine kinase/response regulator